MKKVYYVTVAVLSLLAIGKVGMDIVNPEPVIVNKTQLKDIDAGKVMTVNLFARENGDKSKETEFSTMNLPAESEADLQKQLDSLPISRIEVKTRERSLEFDTHGLTWGEYMKHPIFTGENLYIVNQEEIEYRYPQEAMRLNFSTDSIIKTKGSKINLKENDSKEKIIAGPSYRSSGKESQIRGSYEIAINSKNEKGELNSLTNKNNVYRFEDGNLSHKLKVGSEK